MLYFIPAWYLKNEWKENEQLWYIRRTQTETDDTVKQVQLFRRNHICEYEILLLAHAPNFRHFLHRQSVFRAPYWSVFDAIQEVRRRKQAMFSFHNLNWPRDTEFVYTPFSVIAMLLGEMYANIEFGEYGNPIQVDLYRNGQITRKNIYDDRGFISCTEVYENGKKAYEQYLTEKGVWKLCRFTDGHVAVNPHSSRYLIRTLRGEEEIPFLKNTYTSMEEVIEEVLASWLRTTRQEDIFCAAAHGQHLPLLDRLLENRRTIFSVFQNRLSLKDEKSVQALSRGDCIVTDSEDNLELLLRTGGAEKNTKVNIPPYDTRVDPGISLQLPVQKILFPVDHLAPEDLAEAVKYLAAYLEENKDARVCLFTRNADFGREDAILKQVSESLEKNGYPPEWARKADRSKAEFWLDAEDQIPIMFMVEQCVDELSVSKCVRQQRIFVDLEEPPDLFLQISCVGMGIPQILRSVTQYMRPGRNGRICRDISQLGENLRYYLENLNNWNTAMIQSFELGKTHTTQYLIEQWKEVIDRIGHSKSITAGK